MDEAKGMLGKWTIKQRNNLRHVEYKQWSLSLGFLDSMLRYKTADPFQHVSDDMHWFYFIHEETVHGLDDIEAQHFLTCCAFYRFNFFCDLLR